MKRCVLVVEDDEQIREVVRDALIAAGYEVLSAGNGAEALSALEQAPSRPNVIVLDWMMPVMGGQELLAVLTLDPRFAAVPVLVLSACDRALKIPGLPVAVVLTKPVRMRTLIEVIDRLAGHPIRPSPFVTGRFPVIRPTAPEREPARTRVLRPTKPTPPTGGAAPG